jgi:SAM-dependent methyltransferase
MEYTLLMQKNTPQTFKDHFSEASADYHSHRPSYPENLFKYLASITPSTEKVWDCATGSGQAAQSLNKYFSTVYATDASPNQIACARAEKGIVYSVANAENSGLESDSMDLICVAQALHWFQFDGFFKEVDRVLKADGILAVWSYELLSITPSIDSIIIDFYAGILDGYWPAERVHIENNYQQVNFPYTIIPSDSFAMSSEWNLFDLMGYFSTWSAVKNCTKTNLNNPLEQLHQQLLKHWGDPQQKRMIRWPLNLILSQKPNHNK